MGAVWSQEDWRQLERKTLSRCASASGAHSKWLAVAASARRILRTYSTSFFIVTRFLPADKREQVEVIYAAVRYPDEVVDTFPIAPEERLRVLSEWSADYERALDCESLDSALAMGLNPFASAFAQVVNGKRIPPGHYRSFLDAMRMDVLPGRFRNLDDLVESYIYGSATVVGYFLAYVYGSPTPDDFSRALRASRDLGIALQLTNFLRDVGEDYRRGRVYLPLDMLEEAGLVNFRMDDAESLDALGRVLRRLSAISEAHYSAAEANLDAFSPDCRIAIRSCIDVYRQLNRRIGSSPQGVLHRETVPMSEKFRVLPSSKYWRLPLAYLGAL